MNTIWKYHLDLKEVNNVTMPKNAIILKVDADCNGQPTLWAQVNPDAKKELRKFRIFGTGHPITCTNLEFIGTLQQKHIGLVWHVFEEEL